MKKSSFKYIFIITVVWFVSSCASVRNMTIDQLYPAEATFSEDIKNVAIVNNMMSAASQSDHSYQKGKIEANGKKFAESFANILATNGYFNQVVICDSALRSSDNLKTDRLLTASELKELFQSLDSDMILSLDRMTISVRRDHFYYPGLAEPFPIVRADSYALLRAYSTVRDTPIMSVVVSDSLFWNMGAVTSVKEIEDEAVAHMADLIVARIVPQWKMVDRIYFDGVCSEMRDGAVLMRENDWTGAKEIWTHLYSHCKKNLKVQTAFNIALACELEGNIDEALEWLKKSEKYAKDGSEEKYLIFTYADVLKKRIDDVSKLNLQMRRFD